MSRISIEREGDSRISLSGWVGPSTPSKCKSIGGGRFKPKTDDHAAYWSYPLSLSTCRAMRAQFGDVLDIGPDLNSWAKAALKEEKAQTLLSLADNAELHHVPVYAPVLDAATQSRPYQRVAAAWGAATGSFLLADQQGLGKSIETLATIVEHSGHRPGWHLVMSPSVAVETVWTAEAKRWLKDMNIVVVPLLGTLKERNEILDNLDVPYETRHVFVVANIESARIKPSYPDPNKPKSAKYAKYLTKDAVLPALHQRAWDTVVVDECQRALIRTSGALTQTRAGFEVLSRNSERRIALSGTPMRGKPEQLWGTLHWLRPDLYTSYWNWVQRYFALTSDGYSSHILNGFLPGGEDRLANDLKAIMIRRTKAEVLPDLPPKTYAGTLMDPDDEGSPCGIWLDPTPEQTRQMRAFSEEGGIEFGDEEVLANGTLSEYTRMRQLSNAAHTLVNGVFTPTLDSPKYDWVLNWLREADGEKIVIASQFTSVIDVFAAGLRAEGYKVAVLTGKTSQKARKEMVEKFQETNEIQVFMLNTKAGGVALTLDSADYIVLLDETSVPDDTEQVEDRIHRTSRIHNVTVYYLRTLGSMDEEVAWVAAARLSVQQYLLDGARGVETAKALYYKTLKEAQ